MQSRRLDAAYIMVKVNYAFKGKRREIKHSSSFHRTDVAMCVKNGTVDSWGLS